MQAAATDVPVEDVAAHVEPAAPAAASAAAAAGASSAPQELPQLKPSPSPGLQPVQDQHMLTLNTSSRGGAVSHAERSPLQTDHAASSLTPPTICTASQQASQSGTRAPPALVLPFLAPSSTLPSSDTSATTAASRVTGAAAAAAPVPGPGSDPGHGQPVSGAPLPAAPQAAAEQHPTRSVPAAPPHQRRPLPWVPPQLTRRSRPKRQSTQAPTHPSQAPTPPLPPPVQPPPPASLPATSPEQPTTQPPEPTAPATTHPTAIIPQPGTVMRSAPAATPPTVAASTLAAVKPDHPPALSTPTQLGPSPPRPHPVSAAPALRPAGHKLTIKLPGLAAKTQAALSQKRKLEQDATGSDDSSSGAGSRSRSAPSAGPSTLQPVQPQPQQQQQQQHQRVGTKSHTPVGPVLPHTQPAVRQRSGSPQLAAVPDPGSVAATTAHAPASSPAAPGGSGRTPPSQGAASPAAAAAAAQPPAPTRRLHRAKNPSGAAPKPPQLQPHPQPQTPSGSTAIEQLQQALRLHQQREDARVAPTCVASPAHGLKSLPGLAPGSTPPGSTPHGPATHTQQPTPGALQAPHLSSATAAPWPAVLDGLQGRARPAVQRPCLGAEAAAAAAAGGPGRAGAGGSPGVKSLGGLARAPAVGRSPQEGAELGKGPGAAAPEPRPAEHRDPSDFDLPECWKVWEKRRMTGKEKGKHKDRYFLSPDGKRFDSLVKAKDHQRTLLDSDSPCLLDTAAAPPASHPRASASGPSIMLERPVLGMHSPAPMDWSAPGLPFPHRPSHHTPKENAVLQNILAAAAGAAPTAPARSAQQLPPPPPLATTSTSAPSRAMPTAAAPPAAAPSAAAAAAAAARAPSAHRVTPIITVPGLHATWTAGMLPRQINHTMSAPTVPNPFPPSAHQAGVSSSSTPSQQRQPHGSNPHSQGLQGLCSAQQPQPHVGSHAQPANPLGAPVQAAASADPLAPGGSGGHQQAPPLQARRVRLSLDVSLMELIHLAAMVNPLTRSEPQFDPRAFCLGPESRQSLLAAVQLPYATTTDAERRDAAQPRDDRPQQGSARCVGKRDVASPTTVHHSGCHHQQQQSALGGQISPAATPHTAQARCWTSRNQMPPPVARLTGSGQPPSTSPMDPGTLLRLQALQGASPSDWTRALAGAPSALSTNPARGTSPARLAATPATGAATAVTGDFRTSSQAPAGGTFDHFSFPAPAAPGTAISPGHTFAFPTGPAAAVPLGLPVAETHGDSTANPHNKRKHVATRGTTKVSMASIGLGLLQGLIRGLQRQEALANAAAAFHNSLTAMSHCSCDGAQAAAAAAVQRRVNAAAALNAAAVLKRQRAATAAAAAAAAASAAAATAAAAAAVAREQEEQQAAEIMASLSAAQDEKFDAGDDFDAEAAAVMALMSVESCILPGARRRPLLLHKQHTLTTRTTTTTAVTSHNNRKCTTTAPGTGRGLRMLKAVVMPVGRGAATALLTKTFQEVGGGAGASCRGTGEGGRRGSNSKAVPGWGHQDSINSTGSALPGRGWGEAGGAVWPDAGEGGESGGRGLRDRGTDTGLAGHPGERGVVAVGGGEGMSDGHQERGAAAAEPRGDGSDGGWNTEDEEPQLKRAKGSAYAGKNATTTSGTKHASGVPAHSNSSALLSTSHKKNETTTAHPTNKSASKNGTIPYSNSTKHSPKAGNSTAHSASMKPTNLLNSTLHYNTSKPLFRAQLHANRSGHNDTSYHAVGARRSLLSTNSTALPKKHSGASTHLNSTVNATAKHTAAPLKHASLNATSTNKHSANTTAYKLKQYKANSTAPLKQNATKSTTGASPSFKLPTHA
ncbi:MAG: hypothetical protein WDW38_008527 [Sanguina aurantia]